MTQDNNFLAEKPIGRLLLQLALPTVAEMCIRDSFSLERRENGYGLVMSGTSKAPTYCWISSLSERFSLVYMIATKVVYIKNIKTGTYSPFISERCV